MTIRSARVRVACAAMAIALVACASRPPTTPSAWTPPNTPSAQTQRVATLPDSPATAPSPDPEPASPAAPAPVELFPHVRLDKARRAVEFDAIVPLDCHDPVTPLVYLELVCCTPDTREHESLLMTRARPSHIHAALLAAGFQSGQPGLVDFRGPQITGLPPRGDTLHIEFHFADEHGQPSVATPEEWITNFKDGQPFVTAPEGPGVWGREGGWVFAGSRFVHRRDPHTNTEGEVYDADGAGQVIGLTTFGSETIAWRQVLSPESAITAPVLIARAERVPKFGTPVVVRITPGP